MHKHAISTTVCFFCGKDKDIVAYKLPRAVEAPTRMLVDYEPCKDCAAQMAKGITLIEVTSSDTGAQPIKPGLWPTGRWCVITQESANRLFAGINTTRKRLLVDEDLYSMLKARK